MKDMTVCECMLVAEVRRHVLMLICMLLDKENL